MKGKLRHYHSITSLKITPRPSEVVQQNRDGYWPSLRVGGQTLFAKCSNNLHQVGDSERVSAKSPPVRAPPSTVWVPVLSPVRGTGARGDHRLPPQQEMGTDARKPQGHRTSPPAVSGKGPDAGESAHRPPSSAHVGAPSPPAVRRTRLHGRRDLQLRHADGAWSQKQHGRRQARLQTLAPPTTGYRTPF